MAIEVVFAGEHFGGSRLVRQSIFLDIPGPLLVRRALNYLEKKDFKGRAFVPYTRQDWKWVDNIDDELLKWKIEYLQRATAICAWFQEHGDHSPDFILIADLTMYAWDKGRSRMALGFSHHDSITENLGLLAATLKIPVAGSIEELIDMVLNLLRIELQ